MLISYIILGIIQGLTEFLPVSSSGHVMLLAKWFNISSDLIFLSVVVHFGTLLAVFLVYRKKLWEMIKKPFTWYNFKIILSTLITVIIYLLFKDFIEKTFSGDYLIYGFIFTAIVLIISDLKKPSYSKIKTYNSIIIGLAQGIAIIPAISRSGMTITAGVLSGADRSEATEFSFLLSVPIILGSGIIESTKIATVANSEIFPLIMAFIFAFISGLIAIKIMIKIIKKAKLYYFAFYLLLLSVVLLIVG